jgi:hypothetical protein
VPVQTYVQDGFVVGYLPGTGHTARVSLADCAREGGQRLSAQQCARLARATGPTIDEAVGDMLGTGVGAGGFRKVVKKIAKSKVLKSITSVVSKAVPAPFNLAITAAQGAAKFAKSIKAGKGGALALKGSIVAAAKGTLSPAKLRARAKQLGVDPSEAEDAALIKRVALESVRNPAAKAALRLASDLTDTEPVKQSLALASALQAQGGDNTRAFVVQAPGGQHWRTTVELGAIELGAGRRRKAPKRKAPPPAARLAVKAVPPAKSFRAKQRRGHKGAKKLQPHVTAAANGTITPAQLDARARAAGVPPEEAQAAALIERMRDDASRGSTDAAQAVTAAEAVAKGQPPADALADAGENADPSDELDDGQAEDDGQPEDE